MLCRVDEQALIFIVINMQRGLCRAVWTNRSRNFIIIKKILRQATKCSALTSTETMSLIDLPNLHTFCDFDIGESVKNVFWPTSVNIMTFLTK